MRPFLQAEFRARPSSSFIDKFARVESRIARQEIPISVKPHRIGNVSARACQNAGAALGDPAPNGSTSLMNATEIRRMADLRWTEAQSVTRLRHRRSDERSPLL
jgi:hypothetical protein